MKVNRICALFIASSLACNPPAPKPASPVKEVAVPAASTGKRAEIGKNVWLEITPNGQRRVQTTAEVCFREGQLEMFMCRKNSKEHESLVSGDFDARDLHKALLAAGAVNGSPVKFEPKYIAASGTPIKVLIRYEKDGKETTINAREWVRESKTQKALATDWVFGGSFFFTDREDPKKPQQYAANSGDVICVSNFGTAMLDLPIESSAANEGLRFEAFTDRIPPLGTKVMVILEPQLDKK